MFLLIYSFPLLLFHYLYPKLHLLLVLDLLLMVFVQEDAHKLLTMGKYTSVRSLHSIGEPVRKLIFPNRLLFNEMLKIVLLQQFWTGLLVCFHLGYFFKAVESFFVSFLCIFYQLFSYGVDVVYHVDWLERCIKTVTPQRAFRIDNVAL